MGPDGKLLGTGRDLVASYNMFIAGFPWHVRLNNMNPLDTHDIPRFKTFAIEGAQHVAAGLQFSFPGIPVIWAGDEFGLDGWNGENSRTPIPWNDERPSDRQMIEVYAALAKLRRENPALVDGGMRWLAATDEAIIFVREHKKQSVLVMATRGKVKDLTISASAVAGLAQAERIYGTGSIKLGKKNAHFSSGKLSFTAWRLPAAKH